MTLYDEIVRDIQDPSLQNEIKSTLALFGEKITADKVETLRNQVNEKFAKARNVPRRLSDTEIDDIVNYAIVKTPAVFDTIAEDNNRQIKDFMRSELRDRKMVVTKENLEKLQEEIRETYFRSLVSPGDSVGVEVAMSFGQPLTQMNLDTFHQSGAMSDLGSGVKSLTELFNVSVLRKKNLTTIHFRDKTLTREEIFLQGKALKGVSIKELLLESDIKYVEGRNSLDVVDGGESTEWWYDNYFQMFPHTEEAELREAIFDVEVIHEARLNDPVHYHSNENVDEYYYATTSGNLAVVYDPSVHSVEDINIPEGILMYDRPRFEYDSFLRLRLNTLKCHNLGLSMNDIVSVLKDETTVCVASPLMEGVVDIHPINAYINDTVGKFVSKGKIKYSTCEKRSSKFSTPLNFDVVDIKKLKILFLNVVIKECLSDIIIKGVNGIKNIIPVTENLNNTIKTVRVTDVDILTKYGKSMLWYINLDYMKLKYTGVPIEKVLRLCDHVRVDIMENNIMENGTLSRNPHIVVYATEDPKQQINREFDLAEKEVKRQVKEILNSDEETEYNLPDYPDIYRDMFYNYAYAEGEKIVRKLMRHRKLDNKMILPNNPNEIYDIFGIETVRLYMVREYVHLIESSDSYVTPVNIELLVDYQTAMGFLTPIHATGSSKQGTSSLSAATFGDPVGTFRKAAAMGKTDKINSISSCIMTGKPSLNGSGLSDASFGEIDYEFTETAQKFKKPVEFCEKKYVISGDDSESEPVTIDIDTMINKPKSQKESKFSKEVPPDIAPMPAPDFLIGPESPKPKKHISPTPSPSTPTKKFQVEDDFEIPDALEELPDLKDF